MGKDGYSLDLAGLDNGQFYIIHVPALTCIFLSFISAICVIVVSFKKKSFKTFFSWSRSERFVVYMAICDCLFNVAHTMDHMHIAITKDHPHPKGICIFYGFMLAVFITAQTLMVNIVAINAFMLIFFRKQINFGKNDWRLLTYIFVAPAIGGIIGIALDQMGPNGSFCYFDGVNGKQMGVFFTTVPLLAVLFLNSVFYGLTYFRIHQEGKRLKDTVGENAASVKGAHKAAKTMSLFVTAFFIQWWAMAIYGAWQLVEDVPQLLFQAVTTFSNLGGVLNGIVFIIIKKRQNTTEQEPKSVTQTTKA
ncbi:uncharacterized protein LOC143066614 [Mytilus galloprovincialis]|uniref:G-protein coupled receptors family 1 profile domain-containing protein n=1 Tax=Mytilus galloprovincialis TaxID=29158 RepID=A0A8B6FTT4_MYTGA|nr:Hypothetical predicted protein [Mytilus galloprovincialis]